MFLKRFVEATEVKSVVADDGGTGSVGGVCGERSGIGVVDFGEG